MSDLPSVGRFAGRFAAGVRWARWPVIAAWLALAAVCVVYLPTIESSEGALGALVPKNAEAVQAEVRSVQEFDFPLLSRTVLVQRDPEGLSLGRQAAAIRRAVALSRRELPRFDSAILGALPVTNAVGSPPYARERSTTALTYLFIDPDRSLVGRRRLGERLVRTIPQPPGEFVGLTGLAPARAEQSDIVADKLPLIELMTVLLVALAVGVRLRALGAPLLTLLAVAVAYLVSSRAVAWIGERAGFAVPQEVEPVMVVLVFGVVTDYAVFFIWRFRALLAGGMPRLEAAERATAELAPIVFTAGITVVGATAALLAAQLNFLRVFGPGLAFSVLVSLVVALTLIPAAMAVSGGTLFWPRRLRGVEREDGRTPAPRLRPFSAARLATRKPVVTVIVSAALLAVATSGLARLDLSNPVVRGLPSDAPPRQAYRQAAKGFASGMLSPTVVVLSQPGIAQRRAQLRRLQDLIAERRNIALVLGPAQQPLRGLDLGATLSKRGDAARLFVVLSVDPLGARGIRVVRRLERRMPALLEQAGLPGARAQFAGDSALSAETIDKTIEDLVRVAPIALLVIFLILALFLRALVAPLYLVAASLAAFGAALGLAAYVFGGLPNYDGITYFVPFAGSVLLVSLGSDYNVFLIGRIWQEARGRPLREAVPETAAHASRSITLAGLVLAGSFALLWIIPVQAFRELAFVMTVGLLIDTFLIRTLLVPALVLLVGRRSAWPGNRLGRSTLEPASDAG